MWKKTRGSGGEGLKKEEEKKWDLDLRKLVVVGGFLRGEGEG